MPNDSDTTLCSACRSIDILKLIENLGNYQIRQVAHYAAYSDLVSSVQAGCQLCALLHSSLFREGSSVDEVLESPPAVRLERLDSDASIASNTSIITDVAAWHQDLDTRADSGGFVLEVKAEATLDTDFDTEYTARYYRPAHRSSIYPRPQKLILTDALGLDVGVQYRSLAAFPSFGLYTYWVNSCAYGRKHLQCPKARPVALPARLIDVGSGTGISVPKLAITRGQIGTYVTLSHCWGKARPLQTTSENVNRHVAGIPMSTFPKLFQDAILVTRILGCRYLWIDSLCIIQDDPADWEAECSRMGEIYRLSLCTLAAPDNHGSDVGLLTQRSLPSTPSCTMPLHKSDESTGSITIGAPPPALKSRSSTLSHRAWVLQEQLLSPRTLNFGANGMYFQCHSHEQLETYDLPLPPERMTPWRTEVATDLPKPLMVMAIRDVSYWYSIVRQYSFRFLTYGDDKLPALSGLAAHIASHWVDNHRASPFGTYWAGLWSKDILRGLSWTSSGAYDLSKDLHTIDQHAPSWSWASQNRPVEWKILKEFKPAVECLSCSIVPMTTHQYGQVQSGVLQLRARSRLAILHQRSSNSSSNLRARGSQSTHLILTAPSDSRELADLVLDATAPTYIADHYWTQSPAPGPKSLQVRLLLLGSAESSLRGRKWSALILSRVSSARDGSTASANGSPQRWRRLGLCESLDREKVHARSVSETQSLNWFDAAPHETVEIV